MPHIDSPDIPGIRGFMAYKPASGDKLSELAQQLLRGDSPLSEAERELIAVRVSSGNSCRYCTRSHAGAARALLGSDSQLAQDVQHWSGKPIEELAVDDRLKALLRIADAVRADARTVTPDLVAAARDAGADDEAIHDAVLVAAAFCMYNRYVDGLQAITPDEGPIYDEIGQVLATSGYVRPREQGMGSAR